MCSKDIGRDWNSCGESTEIELTSRKTGIQSEGGLKSDLIPKRLDGPGRQKTMTNESQFMAKRAQIKYTNSTK